MLPKEKKSNIFHHFVTTKYRCTAIIQIPLFLIVKCTSVINMLSSFVVTGQHGLKKLIAEQAVVNIYFCTSKNLS